MNHTIVRKEFETSGIEKFRAIITSNYGNVGMKLSMYQVKKMNDGRTNLGLVLQ